MDTMCCNIQARTVLQKSFQYYLDSKLALLPTESFCKVCQERLFDHVELKPNKSLKNHHQSTDALLPDTGHFSSLDLLRINLVVQA
jgi:hypothetical protein